MWRSPDEVIRQYVDLFQAAEKNVAELGKPLPLRWESPDENLRCALFDENESTGALMVPMYEEDDPYWLLVHRTEEASMLFCALQDKIRDKFYSEKEKSSDRAEHGSQAEAS